MLSAEPVLASLPLSIALFTACTVVIAVAGTLLAGVADQFADRTGIGEAVTGGLLLGAATSLSGSVLSVTAAWNGRPELAVGNALGGIAVQTAFLALADVAYRRANLEHAAASNTNMMQCAVLTGLLTIILLGSLSPNVTLFHVHPATPLLLLFYLWSLRLVRGTSTSPMWHPLHTRDTRLDRPEARSFRLGTAQLALAYVGLALALGLSGWLMELAAAGLVRQTPLSETLLGVLLTSVSTSLPELVTSLAAVRRGALTLAVGGIIGGNAFDTLFAAFSDLAYRQGSIYHEVSDELRQLTAVSLLMAAVLQMGLVRRERYGIGGIGFESAGILLLYGGGLLLVFAV